MEYPVQQNYAQALWYTLCPLAATASHNRLHFYPCSNMRIRQYLSVHSKVLASQVLSLKSQGKGNVLFPSLPPTEAEMPRMVWNKGVFHTEIATVTSAGLGLDR